MALPKENGKLALHWKHLGQQGPSLETEWGDLVEPLFTKRRLGVWVGE